MNHPSLSLAARLVLGLAMGLCVQAAMAQAHKGESTEVVQQFKASLERRSLRSVSEVAQLKLENTGGGFTCGVEVNWGDGQTDSLKVTAGEPVLAEHSYAKESNYVIGVSGKMFFRGLASALPCTGNNQASALLVGDSSANAPVAAVDKPAKAVAASAEAAATSQVAEPAVGPAGPAPARIPPGKRVALLIGNASYSQGMPALSNPPKDVASLYASLKKLNFEVQIVKDGDLRDMARAIKGFGARAQDAQVALFYYSGHGMQAHDENYLIPIGSKVDSEADLEIEAMPVKALMRQIEDAHAKATIVVLDACRDNPVALRGMVASKGLKLVGLKAVQNPPNNTLLVYAALPGTTANDNGVFAKELANQIVQPNIGIRTVFDRVGAAVRNASANKQYIQRDDQLSEDFMLASAAPVGASSANRAPGSAMDAEEEAWQVAKAANSAAGYEAYLVEYPKGKYASAARIAKAGKLDAAARR